MIICVRQVGLYLLSACERLREVDPSEVRYFMEKFMLKIWLITVKSVSLSVLELCA